MTTSIRPKAGQKKRKTDLRGQLELQSMALPAIILLIIFCYLPMWGILIAFQDYDIFSGFLKSPWVGFKHFQAFFQSRNMGRIMRNTLFISFAKLLLCFPAPILLALLINEVSNARAKRFVQTVTYLPYFLSWVIVAAMMFSLLGVENGSINLLLCKLGLIAEPVNWLGRKDLFLPILIVSNIWKGVGYGSIVFLAAISSINPELYEAADVDGAKRLQKTYYITLPALVPQIVILLILQISNILNAGFEDIMLLTNNGANAILNSVSEVIDIHVYKTGIESQRYSYSTAVGLFKSVVNIIMLLAANAFSRKVSDTSLW